MEKVAQQITRILQQEDSVRCSNALHAWVEILNLKEDKYTRKCVKYTRKCVKCSSEQEYKGGKWEWIV